MRLFIAYLLATLAIPLMALQNGEVMKFAINYGVIHAGNVKMTVTAETYKDSLPTFKVISEAKTARFFDNFYKVRDRIEVEFLQENFQSIEYQKKLREGSYKQNRITHFNPEMNYAIYYKKDKDATKWTEKKYDVPDISHDIFTTFFMIKEMEFAVGDTITTTVSEDGENTTIQVVVHRIVKKKTIFGEVDCYEIEPILKGTDSIFKQTGNIYIYLTADERRVPVLLQSQVIFGKFKAILKGYEPGGN